jgi:hypothetical protein
MPARPKTRRGVPPGWSKNEALCHSARFDVLESTGPEPCQLERGSVKIGLGGGNLPPPRLDHTLGIILKAGNQVPR